MKFGLFMKNINKQQLIIEFVSVVFAVILALILNSWRESIALNANVAKVKSAIKKEVIRNDSLIQQSNRYRKNLLNTLYSNRNVLYAAHVSDFPFDVNNNIELESFFKTSLVIGEKRYYERVQVLQENSDRVLILDKNVFDIKIGSDTLKLFGLGNIRLKIPDVINNAWQLAQSTNTLMNMEVELVEKLSTVNILIDSYKKTSEHALQMIYEGNMNSVLPVIEDMYSLELKIMEVNTFLLKELN